MSRDSTPVSRIRRYSLLKSQWPGIFCVPCGFHNRRECPAGMRERKEGTCFG